MLYQKMINTAMNYLAQGHCTEQELSNRLHQHFSGTPDLDSCVKETLKRLRRLHLIDDGRIACRIAERFCHKGNLFIVQSLKKEGFSAPAIRNALEHIGDEYSRALTEVTLLLKDFNEEPRQAQTRMMRFLSSRFFSYETVNKIINEQCTFNTTPQLS